MTEAENTIQTQNENIFKVNEEKAELQQLANQQKLQNEENNKKIDNLLIVVDGKNEEMKDIEDIIDKHLKTIKELKSQLKESTIPRLKKELEASKEKQKNLAKRLGKFSQNIPKFKVVKESF